MEYYKKTDKKIVIYKGKVYDLADYVELHPGGAEFISDLYGKSIDEEFEDQGHSRSAKKLFKNFPVVGYLPSYKHEEEDHAAGLDGNKVGNKIGIDFMKGGVVNQLWHRTDYTIEDYKDFINEPKHLINPVRECRLFDSDFVEAFSKTPWYGIPLFYFPQAAYFLYIAYATGVAELYTTILVVIFAILYASWLEYAIHRFVFHCEDTFLPNNSKFMAIHYAVHGVHHAFPQETNRLVMPIVPGMVFLTMFSHMPAYFLLPAEYAFPFMAGVLFAYIKYDMVHFFLHHSSPKFAFLRDLKAYHMAHHYRNGNIAFGVSTKFWDKVFST